MTKLLALLTLTAIVALPAELPRKSPEFIIQMLNKDGKHADQNSDLLLSKYRGKVVVIEFLNPS